MIFTKFVIQLNFKVDLWYHDIIREIQSELNL